METEFIFATLFNLGINLLYTIVALLIAVIALTWGRSKNYSRMLIFNSSYKMAILRYQFLLQRFLLFVALIVSFGLKG